jgi:hypothetical protein
MHYKVIFLSLIILIGATTPQSIRPLTYDDSDIMIRIPRGLVRFEFLTYSTTVRCLSIFAFCYGIHSLCKGADELEQSIHNRPIKGYIKASLGTSLTLLAATALWHTFS